MQSHERPQLVAKLPQSLRNATASKYFGLGNVRYGSLADILTSPRHVRFTPNNGRWAASKSGFCCLFVSTRPRLKTRLLWKLIGSLNHRSEHRHRWLRVISHAPACKNGWSQMASQNPPRSSDDMVLFALEQAMREV